MRVANRAGSSFPLLPREALINIQTEVCVIQFLMESKDKAHADTRSPLSAAPGLRACHQHVSDALGQCRRLLAVRIASAV